MDVSVISKQAVKCGFLEIWGDWADIFGVGDRLFPRIENESSDDRASGFYICNRVRSFESQGCLASDRFHHDRIPLKYDDRECESVSWRIF